jgi:hypothetical protein
MSENVTLGIHNAKIGTSSDFANKRKRQETVLKIKNGKLKVKKTTK